MPWDLSFWRVNTRAEIEKGDAIGVSIAENGTLTLAPSVTEVFDTKQAYIWSSASDTAGNVYLGTGHEGRIFKVDASGRGSLLYKSAELDVTALAVDSRGVFVCRHIRLTARSIGSLRTERQPPFSSLNRNMSGRSPLTVKDALLSEPAIKAESIV